MGEKKEYTISFGEWYQRTTLHLTEVFTFLTKLETRLDLSKQILKDNQKKLDIKKVERKMDYLEFIEIITNSGIKIRYYEDGLCVLEMDSDDFKEAQTKIKNYFRDKLKPALDYLFSLGAPTPKILANITEEHPTLIAISTKSIKSFKLDEDKFGKVYSATYSEQVIVFKTDKYIVIVTPSNKNLGRSNLIDMQIFFREFKTQLHKYLNIHRKVWNEIEEIKNNNNIKGSELGDYKSRLYSLKKTIEIIKYRMNQMSNYAKTRENLSKTLNLEKYLVNLFEYRFEDLFSTLAYIKEIWGLTLDYVSDAIKVIEDAEKKASGGGIRSIQLLASIGVVTGFITYLTKDTFPTFSYIGVIYLSVLMVVALGIDMILTRRTKNKKYKLSFTEREKEI